MLKLSNLKSGMIFSLVINVVILTFVSTIAISFLQSAEFLPEMNPFIGGLLCAILIAIVVVLLAMTYFWESLFAKIRLGARDLKTEEEPIQKIFDEVYQRTLELEPKCPQDITLKMCDSNAINACAFGRRTIVVNTGLIYSGADADEIAGVIAHEFGHLVHGDTINMWIALQLQTLSRIACVLFEIFICLFVAIVGFIIAIAWYIGSNSKDGAGLISKIGIKIAGVFRLLFSKLSGLTLHITLMFICKASQEQEFEADAFSARARYGRGLARMLSMLQNYEQKMDNSERAYIMQQLYGTHPDTRERIRRLEQKE